MRIVSLLPAATEVVAALEMRHALVGRTHECDHPAGIETVPAVTADLLPPATTPAEIDRAVKTGVAESSTIYRLDRDALIRARPDVIITQQTCAVCAVDGSEVERVAAELDEPPLVLTYDPHRLADLPGEAERIGRALGDARAGLALRSHLERRIDFVRARVADATRPRVAVLEWPDPIFAAGHWVPDVVEAAGGTEVLGAGGERSQEVTWEAVVAADPDVLVLSFCGFDLATSLQHASAVVAADRLEQLGDPRVIAIDGSAWLSRPGPRLLDGVEALTAILHDPHPDFWPDHGMAAELVDGAWVDAAAVRV